MKKTLLFIIVLFAITSCDDSVKVAADKQASTTTVEMLQNVDSTLQVSIVDDYIYVIDNGVVIAKGDKHRTVLLILFLIGFMAGTLIGFIIAQNN